MTPKPVSLCSIQGTLRSLVIHPGEITLITGPVGSGKTRMLRRLAGLATFPPSVTLTWNNAGEPVTRMLFDHSPPLWLAPTLGEELTFGLHPAPATSEIDDLRKTWRLESLVDSTPVDALDRLQATRLMLAAMELAGTRLALLDNPTTSLPLDDAEVLRNDIAAWTKRSTCAVIVACNRRQEWEAWTQQAWHLDAGEDMPMAEPRND